MKRASGVLMHITSLPSRGGVGTLGKAAYAFVDFVRLFWTINEERLVLILTIQHRLS